MTVYRYPVRALAGDYLRSAAGMGVGLAVVLSVPENPYAVVIFGTIGALFGYFGYRTLERHLSRVEVTDAEIRHAALGTRSLAWHDLQRIKLRYFGTRRQHRGSGGFMELKLWGRTTSLTYDSNLEGFDYLAWRATKALRENGLSMDPASAGNLLNLGLDADGDSPPPESGRSAEL
jgi:hypothetical protein